MEPTGTQEHVEDEAFVVIKAAPRVSEKHGSTVCCAAIDKHGHWLRLYPVSFRYLEQGQRFRRWDRIAFRWRRPRVASDKREESRRVDDKSIEIRGRLAERERHPLVNRMAVDSVIAEGEAGRSLAFLRMEVLDFWYEKRGAEELVREKAARKKLLDQSDMFNVSETVSPEVSPYLFKYRYRDADGVHVGTCQDWETEATFYHRRREYGSEQAALDWMQQKFGVELPQQGIVLAMGTHSRRAAQWLINGVVRVNPEQQASLL